MKGLFLSIFMPIASSAIGGSRPMICHWFAVCRTSSPHRPMTYVVTAGESAMTIRNHLARRLNRLAIERLEDRENPSGTVTAALSAHGARTLTGDVDANDVQISLSGAGGSAVDIENVAINGKAGLNVATGLGADTVTLNGVVVANGGASISGGTDQLTVNVNASDNIAGRLRVSGRSGVEVDISGGTLG